MPPQKPAKIFQGAAAALPMLPPVFSEHVYRQFREYIYGRYVVETTSARIDEAYKEYSRRRPKDHKVQMSLDKDCTDLMIYGRKQALALAFFWRNSKFLPRVITPAFSNKLIRRFNFNPRPYLNDGLVKTEIEDMRGPLLDGLTKVQALLSPEMLAHQALNPDNPDDAYLVEIGSKPVTMTEFNDWLELNFFNLQDIPLGMLPRSDKVKKRINDYLGSKDYCRLLIVRMTQGDPDDRLQSYFPGLSLDGRPRNAADWQFMANNVAEYVSKPFGPRATVIPTSEGPRPDPLAALRPKR